MDAAVTLAPIRRATDNRLADSIIAGQQMPELRLPASRKLTDLKPHIGMFLSLTRRADATPQQVRHVGDAPGADMLGTSNGGMRTTWINRTMNSWLSPFPLPSWIA
jgi:histidinol phosphatase-like enzyme